MPERKAPYKTRKPQLVPQTEAIFQSAVIEFAWARGWLCYHTWRSDHSEKGWPDLVLAKEKAWDSDPNNLHDTAWTAILFRELKGIDAGGRRGRPTKEQELWLFTLRSAGLDAEVWWPDSRWMEELK